MKKQLLLLIPIFAVLLMSNRIEAQQDIKNAIASNASNFDSNEIVNFNFKRKSIKTQSVEKYSLISIDESAFTFNVDKSFGSYIIPNTNFLKIVAPDNSNYTHAEFVNKETGDKIFSFELDIDKKVVDMSKSASGVYTLILSNKDGDIHKEDIMIL